MNKPKTFFIVLVLFSLSGQLLNAQLNVKSYAEIGSNNANGLNLKSSLSGNYEYKEFILGFGSELDFLGTTEKFLSANKVNFSKKLTLEKSTYTINTFLLQNAFSDYVQEFNWGVFTERYWDHFALTIGTSFRIYHLNNPDYEGTKANVYENWNLIYDLHYMLKPLGNDWNAGIGIRNMDHFLINQETNPFVYLDGKYALNKKFELNGNITYKSAGLFNLSVNYFGFFTRFGLIWKLDI